jgi:chaperonin GroES
LGINLFKLKIFPLTTGWHSISCTFAARSPGLKYTGGHSFKKLKINTTMAKKVNVTPLHDRVIVKAAAAEEKTAGGIIIPDTAKEKPQRGTVIAAGPGKKDEPVTVKTGDTVLYGKYAGTEIQIDGEDYLIMRESDILAIV